MKYGDQLDTVGKLLQVDLLQLGFLSVALQQDCDQPGVRRMFLCTGNFAT